MEKWRFEEGQEYLQKKIKDKVNVYLNLQDSSTMRDEYEDGTDNFKLSYAKKLDYDDFLSRVQNNKFGVVMKDKNAIDKVMKDIILPDFLESYNEHEYIDILQGRQFTVASQYQRVDQYFCVVEGSANFNFVHPIYRQEVYADIQSDNLLKNAGT